MKISTKLSLVFMVMVLALLLSNFLSYRSERQALLDQVLNHLESVASIQHARLESVSDQNFERFRLVASRTQLRLSFRQYLLDGKDHHLEKMHRILRDARNSIISFSRIDLLNLEGRIVVSTEEGVAGSLASHVKKECFLIGMKGETLNEFSRRPDGKLIQHLAGPLALEGEILGVMIIDSDVETIMAAVQDYSGLGRSGETVLATAGGDDDALILMPTRFDPEAALIRKIPASAGNVAVIRSLQGKKQFLTDAVDYRGEEVLAVTRFIGTTGWGLVVKIDTAEAFAPLKQLRHTLFLVAGSCILVTIVSFFFLIQSITSPITKLTQVARAVSEGNLTKTFVATSDDEIGLLGRVFNTMTQKLTRANAELEKHRDYLEALVKERTSELVVAKEQAEAARITAEEANAAKSDFLARMSHDIRTPLNAVTGLTNIVLKSELTAEQREYLNKVQLAGSNLLTVVNDILDFSKVEAGRLELVNEPFELDQVLEQLADLFSNRIALKDLELIISVAPQVPRQLTGDSGRLTQILTNLIENAVKFTETGEIVVRVEKGDPADGQIGQTAVKFQVSDTGTGISADILPTLFEPFTQADGYLSREHEGTGLGLAICCRLVELMGGRIWAESIPGQGSTFFFTIKTRAQKGEKPHLSLPPDLRGVKALVVDDSATARQVLGDLLESFDFNVTAVESGEEAILELRRANQDEPYQLVLLDWKMPGMDGVETARTIRKLEFTTPETISGKPQPPIVIMVTAYGRELMKARMDTAAVDTSLLKPVKASLLFNTVMELFDRTEGVVPRIKTKRTTRLDLLTGRRVLVVEDSELNRDVAVALLEEAGLVVDTAENGLVAVDKLTGSGAGHYDVVLMDIQMPVLDGYRATRKIREFEEELESTDEPVGKTPVIALTAHALKGEKEKCLAANMDDYLTKPLDEQELLRVLLRWIASRPEEEG